MTLYQILFVVFVVFGVVGGFSVVFFATEVARSHREERERRAMRKAAYEAAHKNEALFD